jgi:hypothetical protein
MQSIGMCFGATAVLVRIYRGLFRLEFGRTHETRRAAEDAQTNLSRAHWVIKLAAAFARGEKDDEYSCCR